MFVSCNQAHVFWWLPLIRVRYVLATIMTTFAETANIIIFDCFDTNIIHSVGIFVLFLSFTYVCTIAADSVERLE